MTSNAYAKDAYKNNQVLTSPPNKLVAMLYDGAIRNIKIAKLAITEDRLGDVNTPLQKAQDIVFELMSTLNFEAGGEIARNLYNLYDYMYLKLIRANIDKDMDALNEVEKFLEELRDTWAQI